MDQNINPFDTKNEEVELLAIEKELSQARESLESDFAKYCVQKTDENLQELFFEKPEEFYKKILQMQNEFLESNISPKVAQRDKLRSDIQTKQTQGNIDQAAQAFLQAHPEADLDAMMKFYSEELPSKYQRELDALPPDQFFEELYKIYQSIYEGQQGQQGQQGDANLPKQIDGIPSQVGSQGNKNFDLPFERI